MMSWYRTAKVYITAAIAVLLAGCMPDTQERRTWSEDAQFTPLIASTDADLSGLEAAALEHCLCQRAGGSEGDCSSDFQRRKAAIEDRIFGDQPHEPMYEFATACAPVSSGGYCLLFSDGEHCIGTGYSVNGASARNNRQPVLCTPNEARAVEEAYSAAFEKVMAENGLPNPPNWTKMTEEDSRRWSVVSKAANIAARKAIDDLIDRIYAGERITPAGTGGGCAG